ncbi:MAG TPA: DUF6489 family protein [Motiliproteus sp.]
MKITIDLDLTPEELRRALGLPDMQAFQQELLSQVQQKMTEGADGYDPMALLRPYMGNQMEPLQRLLQQVMSTYTATDKSKDKNA